MKGTDTLYVFGDVVDPGLHPIKTLLKLMEMSNIICIVGNHELMALDGISFMNTRITTESVDAIDCGCGMPECQEADLRRYVLKLERNSIRGI